MTWSIIARDADGRFGIAIASKFFAVGALCMHSRGGVGALCTQALVNPLYGGRGLALLAQGKTPADVVNELTAADEGTPQRQLHVWAPSGEGAAHTGGQCIGWFGHLLRDSCSVAGNMLADEAVIVATADAFEERAGRPLAERLVAALQAGEAAGGDKRGRQACALRIQGPEDYPELDIRVDDHEDPLAELERLYRVSLERFQPFVQCLATRDAPAGELDHAKLEAHIAAFRERFTAGV